MESNRELLEYAAKAAGNGANSWSNSHKCLFTTHGPYPNEYRKWNPLTDDGDALRLATHCEIAVKFTAIRVIAKWVNIRCQERYLTDRNAATRRAIVRAAAEIGKTMP